MDDLLIDPITLEPYVQPVLASDGYTYSLESLQEAIHTDPWKRSPITQEVLRAWVYPNAVVSELLGFVKTATAVQLFDECTPENIDLVPDDGRIQIWGLPARVSVDEALTRRSLGLPASPVLLMARLWRDCTKLDWLQHPPAIEELKERTLSMGRLFGVDKAVTNPWCLSHAVLVFHDGSKATVEQFLMAAP
jgi:hypothetical protein